MKLELNAVSSRCTAKHFQIDTRYFKIYLENRKLYYCIKFLTSVKLIPLSADTIARRIQDMSCVIDQQLAEHFADNQEPFSKLWALQIDESTDISNKAQLLAYVIFEW
jgi:hypothetical protein